MNQDANLSLLRKVLIMGLSILAGYLHTKPDASQIAAVATDLVDLGVFVWGIYAHWGMVKAPDTNITAQAIARQTGTSALVLGFLLSTLALTHTDARAADVPVKAQPVPFAPIAFPSAASPLTMAGWSGFYGGVDVTATGTGVNLLSLGSLTAGGNALGVTAGWETYNGTYLYGARAGGAYDVSTPGLASFSDHGSWHVGVVFGGNLASLFNTTPPQFPGILANGIPYVAVEGCGHGRQTGECTSLGMEFVIPSSRLTINAEYVNGQYGTSGGVGNEQLTNSNGVRIGGYYHW